MKDLLLHVDVFGRESNLYIHRQQKYRTISGGISTLIVSFILFSLCMTLSLDLIKKRKPSIRTVSSSNSNTSLTLNHSEFFFSYVTIDSKGRPFKYDPKYSLIKAYMEQTGSRKSNSTTNDNYYIPFIDCNEDYIKDFDNISSDIKQVITLYGKCLQLDNDIFYSSPKLSPSVSQFKLEIFHHLDNILKKYDTVFPYKFYFFFQNVAFDTLNYKEPTKKALGFQKYEILNNTMIIISAEISVLYTDTILDYLIAEGHDIKKGYGIETLSAVKSLVQEEEDGYQKHLDVTLSLSHQTVKYIREYPTILDVFSKIGGMIQLILMFADIIVNFLTESELLWHLYNNYFLPQKRKTFKFTQTFNEASTIINGNNNNNITNHNSMKKNTINKGLSKLNTTQILSQSNLNSLKNPETKRCTKLLYSDSLLHCETNLKKDIDNSKVLINPYLQEYSFSKDANNGTNKKETVLKNNLSTFKFMNGKNKEEFNSHNLNMNYKQACCYHYCYKKTHKVKQKKYDPFHVVKNALDINNYFLLSDEFNIMKFIILNKDNKEILDNIEKLEPGKKHERIIDKAKKILIKNYSMQSLHS